MAVVPSTVTLSNAGTITLDVNSVGTVDAPTGYVGRFIQGSAKPIFVFAANRYIDGSLYPITEIQFCDMNNAQPLTGNTEVTETTVVGSAATTAGAMFVGENILTFNGIDIEGFVLSVNLDASNSGTMTGQATTSALTPSDILTVPQTYPLVYDNDICVVVDPYGKIFDCATGEYSTVELLPILNGEGPPATLTDFQAGYTDTVSQKSFWIFSSNTGDQQLAPIIEETQNGDSVAVYSFAFNNADSVPDDVFIVEGNTPNGFYFGTGTGIIEVNPVEQTYTCYEFNPGDSVASALVASAIASGSSYGANKDSLGRWWFTQTPGVSQTSATYEFAASGDTVSPTPGPDACCTPQISTSLGRYRGNVGINWNGLTLFGDAFSGVIGQASFDTFQEYGYTMRGLVTTPIIHKDRRRVFVPRFELDVETGVGQPNCCGFQANWMLDWSKDGGRTFGPVQSFRSSGQIGQYLERLRWLRLGQARQWIFRLQATDPVRRVIIGTYVDFYAGMGGSGPS